MYFPRLQNIDSDFEGKTREAGVRYGNSNSAQEDKATLQAYDVAAVSFVDELDGVSPPPSVADLHARLLAAAQGLERSVRSFAENRAAGQSEEDLGRFAVDFNNQALNVTNTCKELQSQANRDRVQVDLRCDTLTSNNPDHPP